jgi:double-strand break repair protein MRE11
LDERLEKLKVSTLVAEYLAAQNLSVLPEDAMQIAVEQFVDKQETTAISA